MSQRIASDISGSGIEPPARVPAVDLRSPEYRDNPAPQYDPPADPEPVLPQTQTVPQFDASAIEKARAEERSKLNSRIQAERQKAAEAARELEELRAYREEREAEALKAQRDADRKAKREAEKDLSAKERLELREAEWERQREADRNELQEQLAQMRREREQEKAQLKLEREVLELANYATTEVSRALNEKTIAPQFARFINGTTKEIIDRQIEEAKEATAEILAEVAGQQAQSQQRRGVSTANGPSQMGSVSEVESEPLDYTKLSLKDYIEKVRPQLQIDKQDGGIFG
jgi:colicin import membrane protein